MLDIHADKKGNLSSKTYYKTKKGVSQRVININNSLHSTSLTYGATLSDTKMAQMFENTNIESKNTPHSYEVTEIELLESSSTPSLKDDSKPLNVSNNSISSAKLLKGVEKSYDKGKKLLDESKNLKIMIKIMRLILLK